MSSPDFRCSNRSARSLEPLAVTSVLSVLMAALLPTCFSAHIANAEPAKLDFAHEILPILRDRCASCHTDGTYEGGFSLDTREDLLGSGAVIPGNPDGSEMIYRVTTDDEYDRMPPEGDPLLKEQIALLRRWVKLGVPWQEGFSFKKKTYEAPLKPRRPELPPASDGRTHPIDRLMDGYFAQHEVERPARLDDAAFLRRASLDLVGLLPTPAQLDSFLADSSPDKRARAVRQLLASRRAYAEHWFTFWNDLLRNDYRGTGYIDGGRKQITGWLYRSLAENKPYDQFIRELINPTTGSEGFIRGIKWRGNANASQSVEMQFSQNTAQVFLGINMKCASCHDSFIDQWKLDDSWGLAAVIADRPLEIHRCDKPTGRMAQPKFVFPELGAIDAEAPPGQRLEQMAELMTAPDNGRFTRTIVNRLWQRLFGRGIVHPVDTMGKEPFNADLLDYLAVYLADHDYDLKQLLEHICTSETYQARASVRPQPPNADDYVFLGPMPKRMTAEQFVDAVWMLTGSGPRELTAKVDRAAARSGQEAERGWPDFVRASLVPADQLMRILGRPPREQVVSTRPADLTTLQALELTNGQILTDLLFQGAKRLKKSHPDWSADRLTDWLYRGALSREPTPAELATARQTLGNPVSADGLADLMWGVFMLPEFQIVR